MPEDHQRPRLTDFETFAEDVQAACRRLRRPNPPWLVLENEYIHRSIEQAREVALREIRERRELRQRMRVPS